MTKKAKQLIDAAKPYDPKIPLWGIHIIPDGKYTGFFGENGFDRMVLVGEDQNTNLYLINKAVQVDVISLLDCEGIRSIDIPSETGCVRICFYQPIAITKLLSSIHPIDFELVEAFKDLELDDEDDEDEPVGKA